MRTPTDVLLSLQRAVARVLPEPWQVLTELENEVPVRPYAMVGFDGEPETDGLLDHPEQIVPATIYAYTSPKANGTELSRAQAARYAEAIADAIWQALATGEQDDDGPGRPMLLPIFDYDGRNEIQQITITGDDTDGTFALDFDGHTTNDLVRRAQARQMRLALEALPNVSPGDVWVYARRAGGPWAVRFQGALSGAPMPLLTVDRSNLTGTDPDADVEVLAAGSPDPWRNASDFARIDRLSAGQAGDLSDPRQRTVTVKLRLTWSRKGHVPSPEMILQRITARPA